MNPFTSMINSGFVKCVKRYYMIFTVKLTTFVALYQLCNRGYKYLVPATSLLFLGGTYLYCVLKSRDKIDINQTVIITGCDSGLGYSLALYCRQLGATVIASVLQIDGLGAKKLAREGILIHHLDVTEMKSIKRFADFVQTVLSQEKLVLRCFINNSAVMIFGEFEWQTDDHIRTQIEVNLLGSMRITRELMPMIRKYSTRIIVVSSHCNIQPLPGVAAYSATKAGVTAWATAIRAELMKYGVKVVCFIPGSFVRQSNILSRQAEHFEMMKKSMTDEARRFYGDYFDRYSKYFASITQGSNIEMIQDPRLYKVFDSALLDKYPSDVYKNEPWRYFIYHTAFGITPSCIRNILVMKFVQGPPWTKKNEISAGDSDSRTLPMSTD